jgi:anaerobic selenocysteine-containing dehydrogenase
LKQGLIIFQLLALGSVPAADYGCGLTLLRMRKSRFTVFLIPIELPERRKPEGHFYITTRRGKQFNSMVYSDLDPFNAADRFAVLMHAEDGKSHQINDGESVVVHNGVGIFYGSAKFVNIRRGNIELYWPEANVLMPKGVYEPFAGIPEYNTTVAVEKAETYLANKDIRYLEKRIDDLEIEME